MTKTPRQISVLADHAKLEADIEEINFLPTAMFCSKVGWTGNGLGVWMGFAWRGEK
jgi:hypothetical protein